ncbi:hypothetical protein Nepgr_023452 [Nepenthes gracilis]|uniref:Protein disulfide-isomerase n=1 Tax=Nepenthes gracilis TaxID=150966 RepID=A0AAD3T2G9_NEPGR|nr:hypothetical protein Nepgr_023452 [Nepenthes gracilis]
MAFRVFMLSILLLFSLVAISSASESDGADSSTEFVLTLDQSNFSEIVSKHDFIVVEFYAPWCGHCKKLAPEYEKAASVLSSHDPPIALAKVDANDELNRELASNYEVKGFPTLKILRDGGKTVEDYKGPRDAEGIVAYLKKQSGPASVEIRSAEDATNFIGDNRVVIVGIFPEFSGEEFINFTALAEKLRSDYEFGHTLDAKLLPRGELSVTKPTIRLFKPFDELFVDFQDFHVDALGKFVEESSMPTVTVYNKDPSNHPYVIKFFNSPNAKAMLFMNFSDENDPYKTKYHEVAKEYKGKGISFLLGDIDASQGAFQFFGLKEDQVPLIVIQSNDGQKYLKPNLELDHIASWIKEFKDGNVLPFVKSEPIPATNNEPVKIVVADTLQEMVFNSEKNVLLEFYAPWCGHCKNLAPILDEVAVSFENDTDVVIAKLDATANDIPQDTFEVKGIGIKYRRNLHLRRNFDFAGEGKLCHQKKSSDSPTQDFCNFPAAYSPKAVS